MKRKNIGLQKLALNKVAIVDLTAAEQTTVQGGASNNTCVMISVNLPCVATVLATCALTCGVVRGPSVIRQLC